MEFTRALQGRRFRGRRRVNASHASIARWLSRKAFHKHGALNSQPLRSV